MINWIQRIIYQGTIDNQFDDRNQRIIYTNIIYVTLPTVYVLFILIDIKQYLVPLNQLKWDQFIFLVEIAVCVLALYLNKVGHSVTGRLLFIVTWPFLLHIIPIWHMESPTDYYVAYPLGIIFHSVLIQMLFSPQKETLIFSLLMAFNLSMALSSVRVLQYFAGQDFELLYALTNDKYYYLDIILYWLLFSLIAFLLVTSINSLINKSIIANKTIAEQTEELSAINEELFSKNNTLSELNEKMTNLNENLEAEVVKRTHEIEEQNEKLRAYAFYNAHKLRAPLCRIQGLQALKEVVPTEEQEKISQLLKASITELDEVIREIQKIVDTTAKA
jgi:signal transduction histidine kinase